LFIALYYLDEVFLPAKIDRKEIDKQNLSRKIVRKEKLKT